MQPEKPNHRDTVVPEGPVVADALLDSCGETPADRYCLPRDDPRWVASPVELSDDVMNSSFIPDSFKQYGCSQPVSLFQEWLI